MGGADFTVDGQPVNFADEWTYKGVMCSNIPTWFKPWLHQRILDLRADLTAEWVCRVLNHMEEFGFEQATPRIPELLAKTMEKRYWIRFLRRLHAAHDAQAASAGNSDAVG